jgi:quinol monooxygenase YgiN
MYVLSVKVQVKPEHLQDYLDAVIEYDAKGAIEKEPGCFRFDVIQDEEDPTTLYFYEVYRDEEAFQAHLASSHFATFREAVQGWTTGSQGWRGWSRYPADSSWRKQGT